MAGGRKWRWPGPSLSLRAVVVVLWYFIWGFLVQFEPDFINKYNRVQLEAAEINNSWVKSYLLLLFGLHSRRHSSLLQREGVASLPLSILIPSYFWYCLMPGGVDSSVPDVPPFRCGQSTIRVSVNQFVFCICVSLLSWHFGPNTDDGEAQGLGKEMRKEWKWRS